MKRLLIAAAACVALFGCKSVHDIVHPADAYSKPMFYEKYLNPADPFDARIERTLNAVRANPKSPSLHNELGQLLRAKGFPKDAQVEFERAVDLDSSFYPAWYNLGLVRQSHQDYSGAERAFNHTVRLAKGHSEALFQLGLIQEAKGNNDAAIDYYAKALRHNPAILDVRTNPRVLDSKLMQLALLKNYELDHARQASKFLGTPAGYAAPTQSQPDKAPSPQATPQQIVTPSAPLTESGSQVTPPKTTT